MRLPFPRRPPDFSSLLSGARGHTPTLEALSMVIFCLQAGRAALSFSHHHTTPFGACSDGIHFWITLQNGDQLARF